MSTEFLCTGNPQPVEGVKEVGGGKKRGMHVWEACGCVSAVPFPEGLRYQSMIISLQNEPDAP